MENYIITDTCWWSNTTGVTGAVLSHNPLTDTYAAHIGQGEGVNEAIDAQLIKDWGSKLSKELAEAIFGTMERYRF